MQLTDVILTIYCAQMKHKNIPGLVDRRRINIHYIRCSVTQPYNAFHWSLVFVLWFWFDDSHAGMTKTTK